MFHPIANDGNKLPVMSKINRKLTLTELKFNL